MTPPPVILQDELVAAFDKPSGLPVAPGRGDREDGTLTGIVRARLDRALAAVHRLDTEASGVVLFARTKPALDFLSGQFQSKKAARVFVALVAVRGLPPAAEFTAEAPLEDDPAHPDRMRVSRWRKARPSLTAFRTLESFGRFALIEARQETGARHQVRVHLAQAGLPVLNDLLYGDAEARLLLSELKRRYKGREEEKPLVGRLALHCASVAFTHPGTRLPAQASAPMPHDFEVALKYLRRYGGGVGAR
jgi:23S rRNA pseudouridine1911/1915/1917 synthase